MNIRRELVNKRRKVGRELANQIPSIRRQTDVAKMMGLTRIAIDYIESLALYKIYAKLKGLS